MNARASDVEHIELSEVPFDLLEFEVDDALSERLDKRLEGSRTSGDAALPAYHANADKFQQAVINDDADAIRIVAPAGAGKTQTLINRLVKRVRQGASARRTLMLTFDNAAANAIKSKLLSTAGDDRLGLFQARVTTLNAYGNSILKDYFPEHAFSVVNKPRQAKMLGNLRRSLTTTNPQASALLPKGVNNYFYLDFFSLLKNNLFDPRVLDVQSLANFLLESPQATVFFEPKQTKEQRKLILQSLIWLYKNLDVVMGQGRCLDFDDQKLRAWACLNENDGVRGVVQRSWDEVVVDEFQDINVLDFRLIETLAAVSRLVVTGDDDQAIYGFRNCSPDFMIDFEARLGKPVQTHVLQVNYRCPKNIVAFSDALIRNNSRRIPKDPVAARDDDASIKIVQSTSATAEARFVTTFIRQVRKQNKQLGFSDFAVLYRNNAQSLPIQIEFILRDIPYFVREEDSIVASEGLAKLLAILRVKLQLEKGEAITSADFVTSLRGYFRVLPEGFESKAARFIDAKRDLDVFPEIDERLALDKYCEHLGEVVQAKRLVETLTIVARHFKGMAAMIGSLEEVAENEVPLGEIFELAAAYDTKIAEFVTKVQSALDRAKKGEFGKNKDGVALATYFRSKGLQWHTVILIGANEGFIPHRNGVMEEERRLFYVAMTRASSNLAISYLKRSCGLGVHPSRFLFESKLIDSTSGSMGDSAQLQMFALTPPLAKGNAR